MRESHCYRLHPGPILLQFVQLFVPSVLPPFFWVEYMLYFYNMSREESHDRIFKALSDGRRRQILDLLKDEPKTTGSICDHFNEIDRCTVMQHLGVLEKAGLIIVKKEGRFRWNYLDVVPIREIYDRWINQYASPSVEILTRLKQDLDPT